LKLLFKSATSKQLEELGFTSEDGSSPILQNSGKLLVYMVTTSQKIVWMSQMHDAIYNKNKMLMYKSGRII
jgi:hypothetical protein